MIVTLGSLVASVRGGVGGTSFKAPPSKVVVSKTKSKGRKKTKTLPLPPSSWQWSALSQSDRDAWNTAATNNLLPSRRYSCGYNAYMSYWMKAFQLNCLVADFPPIVPWASNDVNDILAGDTRISLGHWRLQFNGSFDSDTYMQVSAATEFLDSMLHIQTFLSKSFVGFYNVSGTDTLTLDSDLYNVVPLVNDTCLCALWGTQANIIGGYLNSWSENPYDYIHIPQYWPALYYDMLF